MTTPRTPEGRVSRIIDGLTPSAAYALDVDEALTAFRADLRDLVDRPTAAAWRSACRALHWREGQLRANGITPVLIAPDAPHYPPEDHDFGAGEPVAVRPDSRICRICDGGPGNECACSCGFEAWETVA